MPCLRRTLGRTHVQSLNFNVVRAVVPALCEIDVFWLQPLSPYMCKSNPSITLTHPCPFLARSSLPQISYFHYFLALTHVNTVNYIHTPVEFTFSVAAPLSPDAEQHRGRAQLDHHIPHAHQPGDATLWQVGRHRGGRRSGSKRKRERERGGARALR